MNNNSHPRPGIFGEILVDRFPDGEESLGGSALNVAWHLRGLGLDPILVSGVGDDQAGETALEMIHEWGLDTTGIQRLRGQATGLVEVSYAKSGEPIYRSVFPAAFDFIDGARAESTLKSCCVLYHGTYIARNDVSKRALLSLRRALSAPVFVDVNLRDPYWDSDSVVGLVRGARWSKFTLQELRNVSEAYFPKSRRSLGTVRRVFGISTLIVTDGEKGARLRNALGALHVRAEGVEVVDPVGAGDAFCAAYLASHLAGFDEFECLVRAGSFASKSCTYKGAVSGDVSFYRAWRMDWGI